MSLENRVEEVSKNLGRIADALEALVAAGGNVTAPQKTTAAPAPAAATPTPATPKPGRARAAATAVTAAVPAPGDTPPTMDDLIDALRELVNLKGAPVAKGVLAEFGANKVSDLKADVYADAYRRMKEVKEEKGA